MGTRRGPKFKPTRLTGNIENVGIPRRREKQRFLPIFHFHSSLSYLEKLSRLHILSCENYQTQKRVVSWVWYPMPVIPAFHFGARSGRVRKPDQCQLPETCVKTESVGCGGTRVMTPQGCREMLMAEVRGTAVEAAGCIFDPCQEGLRWHHSHLEFQVS